MVFLFSGVQFTKKAMACVHSVLLWCAVLTVCVPRCAGHGRLVEPPSRATMWRFGFDTPPNYNDNQLFCGGVGVQYSSAVGGRCGVCGDPWNAPREHEAGGKYATGTIVRKYHVGQIIDITVELTAAHKGYFEFRLCPSDNPFNQVTQDCLDQHILHVAGEGGVRYPVTDSGYKSDGNNHKLKVKLPEGVRCRACMLQWKYNTGNSWGKDPNGTGCIGCGNQEQFYGCADVAIGHDDVKLEVTPPPSVPRPAEVGAPSVVGVEEVERGSSTGRTAGSNCENCDCRSAGSTARCVVVEQLVVVLVLLVASAMFFSSA